MAEDCPLHFLVLGSLDVRADGRSLPLGGGKQRAVLALLLLRAGEVVTLERLVEGLWGEAPPPSAAHTIEGYMSRLRGAIEPCGATVRRHGAGYVLDPGGPTDVDEAEKLSSAATVALSERRYETACLLVSQALPLWRGPVLADVPLHGWGLVEAERLEELRLRVVETWADVELGLGRPAHVAAELGPLVASHPYRERFVTQLMLALYRTGRQVEALEQYEHLRRKLDEDLGLQPSADLRRLSVQIVQQDGSLLVAAETTTAARPVRARARRRRLALTVAVLALAALAAAGLAVVTGTGRTHAHGMSMRVALVVPRDPAASPQDAMLTSIVDNLHRAERDYGVETETVVADESDDASVESMVERLRSGSFGLVLVFGGLGEAVSTVARDSPSTRFAFFDSGPDLPNATTFAFSDDEAGYLAGYLSGLVEASKASRLNPQHVVSVIGGARDAETVEMLLDGFTAGVKKALPDATVLRDYSQEFEATSPCEAIANRQIDAGADIVFAAAGGCSLGALSAAAIRRVYAVGVDADQSYLGDHVLVSTVKRYDQAAFYAIRSYAQRTLQGGTVHLGLRDGAVGIVGVGPGVPEPIRQAVARLAQDLNSGP